MKYDFTSILDRHGKDAVAIDGLGGMPGFTPDAPKAGFDGIPMWVADMNFPTCPTIPAALIARAQHPAYGYFYAMPNYYNAIINWHMRRNGVTNLTPDCIGYENGVLGGVISALTSFASPGDSILLHSPTYVGFTKSLTNNGFHMVLSPLVEDEQGVWRMDFEDMDAKIKANNIHVAVFCSPHNPTGRVWERWELEKAMEIFKANDCIVISDEIWSDLILPGYQHIPLQSISEDARNRTVAFYAPSKTFNLAGLVGSYHIIYNKALRDRIQAKGSKSHYNEQNVLSMHALMAAYTEEGHEWVDELRQVLSNNIDYAYNYIHEHFKGVKVSKPQGTYMLYVDCTEWCAEHSKTIDQLEKMAWDVGVACQDGRQFHGTCHLRFNLALPLSRVKEAFERLDKYVFNRDFSQPDPVEQVLEAGDMMTDFTYCTPYNEGLTLSETVKKATYTAIVFLRYYGCTFCQYDIQQYMQQYECLRSKDAQLLVVLQSDPSELASQMAPEDLPFNIICDPAADLYTRFAVRPASSMFGLMDERSMMKMATVAETGLKHGKYEGNEFQLPAAFIVDSQCKVVYAHYGKSIADVPTANELADKIEDVAVK